MPERLEPIGAPQLPDTTETVEVTAPSDFDLSPALAEMASAYGLRVLSIRVDRRWFQLRQRVGLTVDGQPGAIARFRAGLHDLYGPQKPSPVERLIEFVKQVLMP